MFWLVYRAVALQNEKCSRTDTPPSLITVYWWIEKPGL